MVAPHLGFGLEVDLHRCFTIGILNLVLKYAVDKNCFFVFDACEADWEHCLMIYRSNEF